MGRPKLPRIRPQEKQCRHCKETKPASEFTLLSRGADLLNPYCKDCNNFYRNKWRSEMKSSGKWKGYLRARNLAVVYGMSEADYDRLWRKQSGKCAICEKKPSYRLRVDHCHQSKKVRALLCAGCNTTVGHLEENPELLVRISEYLRSNGARTAGTIESHAGH